MAALFRVELGPRAIEGYLELLVAFPSDALELACKRTMREWTEASKMPPPGFIIDRIEEVLQQQPAGYEATRALLERGDKPPDWEPLQPGELDAMKRRAQTIERKVEEAAKPMEMPKGPDAEEWERRRQAQLRAFREKNREAGEA